MTDFNPTIDNVIDLRKSIASLIERKSKLSGEKQQIQLEFIKLNNQVKGKRLPPSEYKAICRKQQELSGKLLEIEKHISELKTEIRKKSDLRHECEIAIGMVYAGSANDNPSSNILQSLDLLRTKYIEFSGDGTRVSSMRMMASQFVKEIDKIFASETPTLKKLKQ